MEKRSKPLKCHYLYSCWGHDGSILYAGYTDDVERRKRQHAKEKYWWPDVNRVTWVGFDREVEARWAEWAVITMCRPAYNKSRTTPSTPDAPELAGRVVVVRSETFLQRVRRQLWTRPEVGTRATSGTVRRVDDRYAVAVAPLKPVAGKAPVRIPVIPVAVTSLNVAVWTAAILAGGVFT
jgi:hypothetical protein